MCADREDREYEIAGVKYRRCLKCLCGVPVKRWTGSDHPDCFPEQGKRGNHAARDAMKKLSRMPGRLP